MPTSGTSSPGIEQHFHRCVVITVDTRVRSHIFVNLFLYFQRHELSFSNLSRLLLHLSDILIVICLSRCRGPHYTRMGPNHSPPNETETEGKWHTLLKL